MIYVPLFWPIRKPCSKRNLQKYAELTGFSPGNIPSFQADILAYIEKHFCEHLQGDVKRNCQAMIEVNDEVLINQISQGTVRIEEEKWRDFEKILLPCLATIVDLHLFPNVFRRTC